MFIVFFVAAKAIFRRFFEARVFVTIVTLYFVLNRMCAFKRKIALIVVKFNLFPIFFAMAIRTFVAERVFVFIIFFVAANASARRIAPFNFGFVAIFAIDFIFSVGAL